MRRTILLPFLIAVLFVGSCAQVAEWSAPRKQASANRSPAALAADEVFWATFHGGDYERIGAVLDAVTGAYLADPRDDRTAAHVGWLHIWRLAERARLPAPTATVTDDIALSRRYFAEAVALNPGDARYLGFLASATLAEGNIHGDERLTRRGYYLLKDAISAWPEFNLFTAGYVMAGQPADSKRYTEALAWQWQDLDLCAGAKVDRQSADMRPYMASETTEGRKRVCWNSAIAPHNFEGFFLNMGDMIVKSGDWQTAQRVYANARLSRTYGEWAYREVLEQRIADAQRNVAAFRRPAGAPQAGATPMMFDSPYACMACHQRSTAAAPAG